MEVGATYSAVVAAQESEGPLLRRRCVGLVMLSDLYFTSGPGTRKSGNLEANPACTLSVCYPRIDLVLEGEARRVTDRETL